MRIERIPGRRSFLGVILALGAALTLGRLWRAGTPRIAGKASAAADPKPRGWREARHWRKI